MGSGDYVFGIGKLGETGHSEQTWRTWYLSRCELETYGGKKKAFLALAEVITM